MQYKPEEKFIPTNFNPNLKIETNPTENEMKLIAKHQVF